MTHIIYNWHYLHSFKCDLSSDKHLQEKTLVWAVINLPFIINVSCIAAKNKRITPCICCCKYPRELPLPQVKGTSTRSFVDNLLRSYIVSSHTISASKARSKRQVQIKCSNNAKVPTRQQLLKLSSQKGLWEAVEQSLHKPLYCGAIYKCTCNLHFYYISLEQKQTIFIKLRHHDDPTDNTKSHHTYIWYMYIYVYKQCTFNVKECNKGNSKKILSVSRLRQSKSAIKSIGKLFVREIEAFY